MGKQASGCGAAYRSIGMILQHVMLQSKEGTAQEQEGTALRLKLAAAQTLVNKRTAP